MEEKINQSKEKNTKHKKASKVILVLAILLVVALALALVTSIILLFFSVSEIEVAGDSRYTYAEIIEASGIEKGARLYYLNEEKAENAILSAFPYLKSVKVYSYFPNRVKIEIEEFESIYLVSHADGFCYVNDNFEILEIISQAPDYDRFTGIFIKLEEALEGEIGTVCEREDINRASELIEIIREYGFYQDLNIVDVDDKYNNSFVVGKKYKFIVGAMSDVEEKLDVAFKVCLSDSFIRENNAIIDATDKKKAVLRYVSDENIRQEFDFCQK